MSAEMETKYTTVGVDTDEADSKNNYFGYIYVRFNADDNESTFFMETFEGELLAKVKNLFTSVPNVMVDKEIRLEDASLLIDLPSISSKIYAADVHKMVIDLERSFQQRAGL